MYDEDNLLNELLEAFGSEDSEPSEQTQGEDEILAPLLSEISLIQDKGVRSFVRAVLLNAPKLFWTGPSSCSGKYHPPDERGEGGNVLHTKRVVRIAQIMAVSQERSSVETDVVIAACILHDLTKVIEGYDGKMYTDPMHPYTVDKIVTKLHEKDMEDEQEALKRSNTLEADDLVIFQIMKCIRTHLGIWSPIPETIPSVTVEWIVHLADNLASKLHMLVDEEVNEARWKI